MAPAILLKPASVRSADGPWSGLGLRAFRALRGPEPLQRGISGAAERLGINLPATERFATRPLNWMRGIVQPSARFGVR
jgi:hypothetical protein